jgi:hypothetical protein
MALQFKPNLVFWMFVAILLDIILITTAPAYFDII